MTSLAKLLPKLSPAELQSDQSAGIIAGNAILASTATIAILLRLWARRLQNERLFADDFVIFAALPPSWGLAAATIVAAKNGLGRHLLSVTMLDPTMIIREGEAYFATEVLWTVSIPLVKISILLFYMRIFGGLRWMRLSCWSIAIYTIIWAIVVIIVEFTQCVPLQGTWDKTIDAKCIQSGVFFVVGSALNTIVDFVIVSLPLRAVWNLQMPTWKRVSVSCIFLLGSLTCVISLVRLVVVGQNYTNLDITYALSTVTVWSTAEPCLGILAACLPTMTPLVTRRFGLREAKSRGLPGDPKQALTQHKFRGPNRHSAHRRIPSVYDISTCARVYANGRENTAERPERPESLEEGIRVETSWQTEYSQRSRFSPID